MPKASAYSVEEQLGWDELPAVLHDPVSASASSPQAATAQQEATATFVAGDPAEAQAFASSSYGSTLPPWSAAHPYVNLHGPKSPITAKVVGNVQVNEAGTDNETHHIVLDFGAMPFPVLEQNRDKTRNRKKETGARSCGLWRRLFQLNPHFEVRF